MSFFVVSKNDIFSQNGEDGVIDGIIKRLNITSGWVCGIWSIGWGIRNYLIFLSKTIK